MYATNQLVEVFVTYYRIEGILHNDVIPKILHLTDSTPEK